MPLKHLRTLDASAWRASLLAQSASGLPNAKSWSTCQCLTFTLSALWRHVISAIIILVVCHMYNLALNNRVRGAGGDAGQRARDQGRGHAHLQGPRPEGQSAAADGCAGAWSAACPASAVPADLPYALGAHAQDGQHAWIMTGSVRAVSRQHRAASSAGGSCRVLCQHTCGACRLKPSLDVRSAKLLVLTARCVRAVPEAAAQRGGGRAAAQALGWKDVRRGGHGPGRACGQQSALVLDQKLADAAQGAAYMCGWVPVVCRVFAQSVVPGEVGVCASTEIVGCAMRVFSERPRACQYLAGWRWACSKSMC